jgi:hypothetical protein
MTPERVNYRRSLLLVAHAVRMEPDSSADAGGIEPIIVELDPVVADLGTTRQLWIPTGPGAERRVVTVTIPPGVEDGTLLRVPAGDLVVRVHVQPFVPGLAPDSWVAGSRPGTPPPPRRRRPSRRTTILLVVLAAVGTAVVAVPVIRGSRGDLAPAAPRSSSTAAGPTGMSPARYQGALTAFDKLLTPQFQALKKARTPMEVSKALSEMQATLSTAKANFGRLEPPVAVQYAHAMLLESVKQLTADLAKAESAAANLEVCAGSSATALISRSAGAGQLRAAAAKLAADPTQRYRVGGSMPPSQPDPDRRPGNGFLVRHDTDGRGRLVVDNTGAGTADTVLSLAPRGARASVVAVYVRRGEKATVLHIGAGAYQVFMAGGQDWDSGLHAFTRACTFEQVDYKLIYSGATNNPGSWVVPLRRVIHGTVKISRVPSYAFPTN